jgi:hypothetical protein
MAIKSTICENILTLTSRETERGHVMETRHSTEKKFTPNESHIIKLIMLSNSKGSLFATLPKDIPYYMANILKHLPDTTNILDRLVSGLTQVSVNYKNDCWFFKNDHHDIACEVEYLMELIKIEKGIDEKQAFVCLNIFIRGLYCVLEKDGNDKFLKKLNALYSISNCKADPYNSFFKELQSAHATQSNLSLDKLIAAIYVAFNGCENPVIQYLNNGNFQMDTRAALLLKLKEVYKNHIVNDNYRGDVIKAELDKDIEFHLSQPNR